jgi:ABC-type nitrate/sulfonate/bicarbonate transport system permease component
VNELSVEQEQSLAVKGLAPHDGSLWRDVAELFRTPRARAILSLLVVALIWEFGARAFVTNSLFIVPLSTIVAEGVNQWRQGTLQHDIAVSSLEVILGFGIGAGAGVLVGLLMAASKTFRDFADPWVSGLYSTPIIALTPLLILLFGIDMPSKVAVIILLVIFPVLINTFVGLTAVDVNLLDVARSFGANQRQMMLKIRLPAALPVVVAGFRLGVGRALIGVVVGELVAAKAGLGYLITISAQTFNTAGVYLGVLILAISGVLAMELLKALERWLAPWRQSDTES